MSVPVEYRLTLKTCRSAKPPGDSSGERSSERTNFGTDSFLSCTSQDIGN